MKRPRATDQPDSPDHARLQALRWLGARELTEFQIRQRLERRGFLPAAVSTALRRLKEDGTLDDNRTARALVRTEAHVKRHGPQRVLGKLLAAGVDRDRARAILGEEFTEEDQSQLMERALDKRLRGRIERLKDPLERRKLVAHLVRQGYSATAASALIRQKSRQK